MSGPVPNSRPLHRQVALVTGGARRIGRAIAVELARAGADVGFTYRDSESEALNTLQELQSLGVRAMGVRADLTSSGAGRSALAAIVATLGRLDVVVNNVGRYEAANFEEITDGQWETMLATNLTAPFLVSREAIPYLRSAGGGRIIQLTSVGALRAFPTHAHYSASKAGLAHLTRAMARALAPTILVNAVAPGLITFDPELSEWEEGMRARTPLQRSGRPTDVANAVRFFATCNPFITGQTLVVDGGLSLI